MYYQGTGVRRDYRQAAEWFRRAAEQNCAQAQFNLGVLYQTGLGVPLNYGEAYKWFTLAIQGGYADGRRVLEALTQIMTKPQLRDGKASVSEWVSNHNNPALATQKAEPGEQQSYTADARP
jgi:TPR repeat protein